MLFLFGATCVVLLILCANLTNLVLVRDAKREQEIAVRLALGAGRMRLLRQWLTEALLLSVIGALAGLIVASWVKIALISFMPPDYRVNLSTTLGWRLVSFTLLVSLLLGLGLGLAPAWRAARTSLSPAMRGESRTFVSGGGLFSLRSLLILVQVALCLPLLIVSALFLDSLQELRGVDAGFSRNNVLVATVNPSLNGYRVEQSRGFYRDLLLRLRSIPGVESASLSSDSPISGEWDQLRVVVEGYQPDEGERMTAQSTLVSPDYFRSLAITLVAGREFNETDAASSPDVAIVNEKFAHHYFGNANPIGKKIGTDKVPDTTIVGVVRDAQYMSLRKPPTQHFYQPISQQPNLFDLTMHVRITGEPLALVDMVRAEVRNLDPHLPLYNVKTLATQIDESLTQERVLSWLCTAFGVLATLLAALGLYGVLAFSVAQRTREIGIRLALGAQARDVFKMVIGQGMLVVLIGAALGVGASLVVTRVIASLLFGVTPTNATTFIVAAFGVAFISLIACYVPARRAKRVDPLVALRYE
ncbi:MAG: ADOP family duplicated permease [Pyrinomonadaceae bacterium]